jgi:long-chain acyl-CoA synthetase
MSPTREVRFADVAEENAHAAAIIDGSGRVWTRGVIAGQVNRLSRALREEGMRAGDVLAIVAPNCAEYMIVFLAATQIGMFVVPVNWHLTPREVRYIVENSAARVLVGHARCGAVLQAVTTLLSDGPPVRISICGEIPGFTNIAERTMLLSTEAITDPIQGRRLSYTSATSGFPKGVLRSIANADLALDAAIRSRSAAGRPCRGQAQLYASMLYHGAPLEAVSVSMHMGRTVILLDKMDPEAVLRVIHEHGVGVAYIVPTLFSQLLALNETVRERYSVASLERVIHTGAACPVDVKRRMIEWWGPVLWEAYGATEGSGTIVGSADWLRFPGTVGRAMAGTRLKIIGDDGLELPVGQIGAIYLTHHTGEGFEYLGDPEKTRECHIGDFFTVGDVGYMNADGFLFISDRKSNMINLSGMKVYAAEIENVLMAHPDIIDCAVFGIPDPRSGEAVVALVQPRRHAQESVEPHHTELRRSVIRFLCSHLPAHKLPRRIECVEDIPRDPTGKLQRNALRQRYLCGITPVD